MKNSALAELKLEFRKVRTVMFSLLGLLWAIFLADSYMFHGNLQEYGIHPHDINAIWGILTAPFLHANLDHIVNNTIGILMLGTLVLFRSIRNFISVSLLSMFASGLGTWLVGKDYTVHIGYSGVIFGYFGYLLFAGIFEKKFGAILLSIFTVLCYGVMIFGVLPTSAGISWEGHLFGFFGGVLSAKLLKNSQLKQVQA